MCDNARHFLLIYLQNESGRGRGSEKVGKRVRSFAMQPARGFSVPYTVYNCVWSRRDDSLIT